MSPSGTERTDRPPDQRQSRITHVPVGKSGESCADVWSLPDVKAAERVSRCSSDDEVAIVQAVDVE